MTRTCCFFYTFKDVNRCGPYCAQCMQRFYEMACLAPDVKISEVVSTSYYFDEMIRHYGVHDPFFLGDPAPPPGSSCLNPECQLATISPAEYVNTGYGASQMNNDRNQEDHKMSPHLVKFSQMPNTLLSSQLPLMGQFTLGGELIETAEEAMYYHDLIKSLLITTNWDVFPKEYADNIIMDTCCRLCNIKTPDYRSVFQHILSHKHWDKINEFRFTKNDAQKIVFILTAYQKPKIPSLISLPMNGVDKRREPSSSRSNPINNDKKTSLPLKSASPAQSSGVIFREIPFLMGRENVELSDIITGEQAIAMIEKLKLITTKKTSQVSQIMQKVPHTIKRCTLCGINFSCSTSALQHSLNSSHLRKIMAKGLPFSRSKDYGNLEKLVNAIQGVNPPKVIYPAIVKPIKEVPKQPIVSGKPDNEFPFLLGRKECKENDVLKSDDVVEKFREHSKNMSGTHYSQLNKLLFNKGYMTTNCAMCSTKCPSPVSLLQHVTSLGHLRRIEEKGLQFSLAKDWNTVVTLLTDKMVLNA